MVIHRRVRARVWCRVASTGWLAGSATVQFPPRINIDHECGLVITPTHAQRVRINWCRQIYTRNCKSEPKPPAPPSPNKSIYSVMIAYNADGVLCAQGAWTRLHVRTHHRPAKSLRVCDNNSIGCSAFAMSHIYI